MLCPGLHGISVGTLLIGAKQHSHVRFPGRIRTSSLFLEAFSGLSADGSSISGIGPSPLVANSRAACQVLRGEKSLMICDINNHS